MPKQWNSYAPRIPPGVWERHRNRIETLFLHEDKTLNMVMGMMEDEGLRASESQYERQLKVWGIRKNRTKKNQHATPHFPTKYRRLHEQWAALTSMVDNGLHRCILYIHRAYKAWNSFELSKMFCEVVDYIDGGTRWPLPLSPDPESCHQRNGGEEYLLSSAPMERWDTRMWESVGVTTEEWVSRGWNVFFGSWG